MEHDFDSLTEMMGSPLRVRRGTRWGRWRPHSSEEMDTESREDGMVLGSALGWILSKDKKIKMAIKVIFVVTCQTNVSWKMSPSDIQCITKHQFL